MLYDNAKAVVLEHLLARGLDVRNGMTEEQARDALVRRYVAKQVAEAWACGVRPTYTDYLNMHPIERECWQQTAADAKQLDTALLATATGNIGMGRSAVHAEDEPAQRWDALEEVMSGMDAA